MEFDEKSPLTADIVQVGDIVVRKPITISDRHSSSIGMVCGRVIWVHPQGRYHVVEFGKGPLVFHESFIGVKR